MYTLSKAWTKQCEEGLTCCCYLFEALLVASEIYFTKTPTTKKAITNSYWLLLVNLPTIQPLLTLALVNLVNKVCEGLGPENMKDPSMPLLPPSKTHSLRARNLSSSQWWTAASSSSPLYNQLNFKLLNQFSIREFLHLQWPPKVAIKTFTNY